MLGALPAILHAAPRDVALVGLGSGDTAWAAGCRRETERLTVFEISSPQPRILGRLPGDVDVPDTGTARGPAAADRVEDGRKALDAEATLYDVIEIDATGPRPRAAATSTRSSSSRRRSGA